MNRPPLLAWLALCMGTMAVPLSVRAGEAPLVLQASGSYHRVQVPLAVQMQTRLPDLGDLQVLNARGEPLPFAWLDAEADAPSASPAPREQALPFFKAPAAASAVDAAQQGGWIVDARLLQGRPTALQLTLSPGAQGVFGLAVDTSPDLQHWQPAHESVQVLALQRDGLRLENTRIELDGRPARYLRLRPRPGSAPLPLARVTGVAELLPVRTPPLQWSEPLAPTACTAAHCDYLLPRHLPLEQAELLLAAANTLAPVQWWVQDAPGTRTLSPRHRVRAHLHGLREKTAPATATATPEWYALGESTAYWLALPQGEVRSPATPLDAGLHQGLRIVPRGGMAQFGAQPPRLRVGARAVELVFLAREPAPYRLAWGSDTASAALPLAQLMPTRQAGADLPDSLALVSAPAVAPAPVTAAPAPAASSPAPEPSRKPWLWAALLLALAVMGVMAATLLKGSAAKPAGEP